jgi:Pyridoxamine 5'-phosphate oxidase
MASWSDFESAAPVLAAIGRERMDASQLVMMGTLRRSGWPRLTPIEYFFFEGELTLGGMWQSQKMRDLLRDPRCVLHSVTTSKDGDEGDFKLYGRATPRDEPEHRGRYLEALREATGFTPQGPMHLFALDMTEAAYLTFGAGLARDLPRLQGSAGVTTRLLGQDSPDSAAWYLVATWKA